MMTSEDLYSEDILEEDRLELEGENINEEGDNVNEEGGEAPAEGEGADGEDADKKVVKPKRVVRNPQPKLNEETLKGKRGLTALPSYFERVKFKGKGHEEEDLSVILKTYEYWCHRLFPKYPFDECIAKIEKLGSKKAVLTHIKRIRMDMLVEDDQPIVDNDDSEPENNVDNEFDNLFDAPHVPVMPTTPPPQLTEEQQERIRLNKERAERLRRERLLTAQERAQQSLGESSAGNSNAESSPINDEPTDAEIQDVLTSQQTISSQVNNDEPTDGEIQDYLTSQPESENFEDIDNL